MPVIGAVNDFFAQPHGQHNPAKYAQKQHVQRQLSLAATLGAGSVWSSTVAAAQQAHAPTMLAEVVGLGIVEWARLGLALLALAIVWMLVLRCCRAWCWFGFRYGAVCL
jgi:hypothetical protein